MNKEEGRRRVADLVAAFRRLGAAIRGPGAPYNETQLRTDFLDPLLEALGWDVANRAGAPQHLRDVVQEATVAANEGRSWKRPDYALRVAGRPKWFLEAKKPSVHVGDDADAAFQTRRYGFSATHPMAVLSNFDRTIVYSTLAPPAQGDGPRTAILREYTAEQLILQFDELYDCLSREAAYDGRFDQQFPRDERAAGALGFDAYFLRQVEQWRLMLAQDIVAGNPAVSTRELNLYVQRLLNRIVFLRICEDRHQERYEQLRQLNPQATYDDLKAVFERAERRYNSGLFRLIEDPTLALRVSSDVLRTILEALYFPACPYTFAVVETSVLGSVYELYLAKQLSIEPGVGVQVVERPEVRASGGVYPTPVPIIDAILDRTLGPIVDGKQPADLARLRVVDPACGSGSFLLRTFRYLIDWHIEAYRNQNVAHDDRLIEGALGAWRLSLGEKRRILSDCIYGVDVDPQAADVARLGLLVALIEEEDEASLEAYQRATGEPPLPSLDRKVLCGNALISPELVRRVLGAPSVDILFRLNPLEWEREFPEVFHDGGFDAVVGNPPYVRIQRLVQFLPEEVRLYQAPVAGFTSAQGDFDKYHLFVERGVRLLKESGRLGFIIPHKFMTLASGRPLRRLIGRGRMTRHIVHFGIQQVFPISTTYTCVLVLEKAAGAAGATFQFEWVRSIDQWLRGLEPKPMVDNLDRLGEDPWTFVPPSWRVLFGQIRDAHPRRVSDVARVFVGVQTSADKLYIIREQSGSAHAVDFTDSDGNQWSIERSILRPSLYDAPVDDLSVPTPNSWIIFPYVVDGGRARLIEPSVLERDFPLAWQYLTAKRAALEGRDIQGRGAAWYAYGRTQSLTEMSGGKLIFPILATTAVYSLDVDQIFVTGGGNGPYYLARPRPDTNMSLQLLAAILSYPVVEAMLRAVATTFQGGYYSHSRQFLDPLPVPAADFGVGAGLDTRRRIEGLIDRMVDLHRQAAGEAMQDRRDAILRVREDVREEVFRELDALFGVARDDRTAIQETFAERSARFGRRRR